MRNFIVILIICVVAAVIGGTLYLYGPEAFHVSALGSNSPTVQFVPLAQGDDAAQVNQPTNYRIQNTDQLAALWELVYGVEAPTVPAIDFTVNEVLAVFDGSHSTTGYKVTIKSILDTNGKRMVQIIRTTPGSSCQTAQKSSSPFEIVKVPKTPLPITHTVEIATASCN